MEASVLVVTNAPVSIVLRKVGVEFPRLTGRNQSLRGKLAAAITSKTELPASLPPSLRDISLRVEPGTRLGVLGANGAGKSTLLRVVSGVLRPSQGHARISGIPVSLLDLMMGLNDEADGIENIYLQGVLRGVPRATIRPKVGEILEFAGLEDYSREPVRTFSSGMRLRLAFSTLTTLLKPDILVLDEWLAVGDESFRALAEARLKALIDDVPILVLATHSRDLIEKNCNRAILLERGQIIFDGSVPEASQRYFSTL